MEYWKNDSLFVIYNNGIISMYIVTKYGNSTAYNIPDLRGSRPMQVNVVLSRFFADHRQLFAAVRWESSVRFCGTGVGLEHCGIVCRSVCVCVCMAGRVEIEMEELV